MTAPVRVDCLVCGSRRHWWGYGWYYHQVGRVQPFPRGASMYLQPILVCGALCSRECGLQARRVVGARVELSPYELARRQALAQAPAMTPGPARAAG